ncbi:E set domain-containing protein [Saitoella complicata NRRL Y-17804]|uniref:Rho GDP-dissociation inhibitor n=1 Tax=Saitoella complicata (strain BCRC 22490 / CBS 7301 / JCM 7358 / NBRC 10748 / NRRL Y-17804) TaxID=698492 RepID=A0A0E9NE71_SAICN|nr:E set domain-containing protein [Saitoella complicata NRRL Y-17804]ODQ49867.1 E set domain-containing protein [Saitoella complicata NRRL Y-17804]GAO47710.1 hypothetical protein G7K_1909-t1 [Saitoella complicata NRRL Y-17804]
MSGHGVQPTEDELRPSMTEGYNPTAKKTIDEYANLDANDESLRKWKESLGISANSPALVAAPGDNRKVVVLELALEVAGRPDVVLNLEKQSVQELKDKPFILKEGSEYRMKVKFRIQHEVISGLRYLHVVKRKGIKVDKAEEMIGSYGPNTQAQPFYEKKFAVEEAPSGLIARGSYDVRSKFADDDGNTFLEWQWGFKIAKGWDEK